MSRSMFSPLYLKKYRYKQTEFKIGDNVKWTSHSPKGKATKKGIIVAVIEPFEMAQTIFTEWHKYNLSPSYGMPRAQRSYLISVKQDYVKGKGKPKLYFPFSNLLTKVEVK